MNFASKILTPLYHALTGTLALPVGQRRPNSLLPQGYEVLSQNGNSVYVLHQPELCKQVLNTAKNLAAMPRDLVSLLRFAFYQHSQFPKHANSVYGALARLEFVETNTKKLVTQFQKNKNLNTSEREQLKNLLFDLNDASAVLESYNSMILPHHPLFNGNVLVNMMAAYVDPGVFVPHQDVPAELQHLYGAEIFSDIVPSGSQMQQASLSGKIMETLSLTERLKKILECLLAFSSETIESDTRKKIL